MKTLIAISLIVLLTVIVIAANKYAPSYRHPNIKELQQQYQTQASKRMLEALELVAFSSQLDCPCYDVAVSTVTGGLQINVNRDRCPETSGK